MQQERLTEYRLALVLNGGVSLAVWMAGVVYEIDLLRRCDPDNCPDDPVLRRWHELCYPPGKPQRRVSVDVIAGTSAGGINGTLLATAIANGGSLDPPSVGDDGVPAPARQPGEWLRELWTTKASLETGKLLPESESPLSILDGDYFEQTIRDVLTEAGAHTHTPEEHRAVTLFVTSTTLCRSEHAYLDSFGRQLTVTDHRRLFQFRSATGTIEYQPPPECEAADPIDDRFTERTQNDFIPPLNELTRAARASASYPVAFNPVVETPKLAREHRAIPENTTGATGLLLDGGLLDNSPFEPVLREVARQPLRQRTERLVVYVVPSNGSTPTREADDADPSLVEVVTASLFFPREADFRTDIAQLETMMRESNSAWADRLYLFSTMLAEPARRAEIIQLAKRLVPAYRRARAASGVWEAQGLASGDSATPLAASNQLTDDDVDRLVRFAEWLPPEDESADGGFPGVDPWRWGISAVERSIRILLGRLRSEMDDCEAEPSEAQVRAAVEVDRQLRRSIAIRDAAEQRLKAELPKEKGGVEAVAATLNSVLRQLRVQEALQHLVDTAIDEFLKVRNERRRPDAATVLDLLLAIEVLTCSLNQRASGKPVPRFRLLRIGPDTDMPVFGGTDAGGIADELGERKLYGTQIGHFGAFGMREWREWDWLCGRLDAVAQLGPALGADHEWVVETQRAVLDAEGRRLEECGAQLIDMSRPSWGAGSLYKELKKGETGRGSLYAFGQRLLELPAIARFGGRLPGAVQPWLRCLVQPTPFDSKTWLERLGRWLTGPARAAAWQRLTGVDPMKVAEPEQTFTPWYLRWRWWSVLLVLIPPLAALPAASGEYVAWWLTVQGVGVGVLLVALLAARRRPAWLIAATILAFALAAAAGWRWAQADDTWLAITTAVGALLTAVVAAGCAAMFGIHRLRDWMRTRIAAPAGEAAPRPDADPERASAGQLH